MNAQGFTDSTKLAKLIVSVAVLLGLTLAILCVSSAATHAKREGPENGQELKGIPFDEFWEKVSEEGRKWAGGRVYIRKISSGTVQGFDRHSGLSPFWEAQIVRCSAFNEQAVSGKNLSFCKGKAIVLRMAESGLIGLEPGIQVKKEGKFLGNAISFDRIKLSAQAAEEAADGYKHYHPIGFDSYAYELNIDHSSNRPVWIIKKACSLLGITERRCKAKDHWIVKVDAETGDIIK